MLLSCSWSSAQATKGLAPRMKPTHLHRLPGDPAPGPRWFASRFQFPGDRDIRLAGLGNTRRVVVGEDNRRCIMVQSAFDHFPGIDCRPVNGAPEQLLKLHHMVLVIQEQAAKNFTLATLESGPEIVAGCRRTREYVSGLQAFQLLAQR